jgi:shikimate dehydrogenase
MSRTSSSRRISGATSLYALIGDPVDHSLSPRLMNGALARLGIDAIYVALPTPLSGVAAAVRGLEALGVAGANVTAPLKAAVLPLLREQSRQVRICRAANVLVRRREGGFRGINTDGPGLVLALREVLGWRASGRRAAIVGAGGAARAAAQGLLAAGATGVTLLARDPARAAAGLGGLLAAYRGRIDCAALGGREARTALARVDMVVHATPHGRGEPLAEPLVQPSATQPEAIGCDLVYGSRPSAFASAWQRAGRICLEGRDHLAAQAQLSLRSWLGEAPPLDMLRRSICESEAA